MLSNFVNKHVVNKLEVEKSRTIKKIAQRNETHHPGKITQVTWNTTKHTKIHGNQYTDKVVGVTVVIQRQFHQIQTMNRKIWRRNFNK